MGPEPAAFHPSRMPIPANFEKSVEAGFSLVRRCGAGEARPHARSRVGREGELADQQQAASGVLQRQVHAPLPVVEGTVAEEAVGHARNLRVGVAGFHAHQGEEAMVDGTDDPAVDLDAGFGHALDQGKHAGLREIEAPS